MIRNVFLDLDNTLFDFTKAEHIALARTLRLLDVDPAEATLHRYSELNLEQWKLLELGKITREQVKVRRFENLFRELEAAASPEQAATLYENFLGEGHYYIDGAEDLLKALYGRYRLYLASNGTTSVQQSRLASAGIAGFFDGIFLSEAIGADKPSKAFFSSCFSQIPDFRKEETVIVGDSLTSDIQGGKNAGIGTVWYQPYPEAQAEEIRPDAVIRKLSELPELLRTL